MSEMHLTPWEQEHGLLPRANVNLLDAHLEQPRYEAMVEALRREGPVIFYPYNGDPGYQGFWFITDNNLVKTVLAQKEQFSSHGKESGGGLMIHDLPDEFDIARKLMIMQDDPEHSDQRKLIEKHLRPSQINHGELAAFLQATAQEVVEAAVEAEEVDFVRAVAGPVPLAAIAHILRIPEDEREQIYVWGNNISLVDSPPGEGSALDISAAFNVVQAAGNIRRQVRAGTIESPILEALHHAIYNPYRGEEPSAERFIEPFQFEAFFVLLFLAGNETTRNSLAHGIKMFAKHPDQWQQLRAQPELLDSATDEIVRWATPVRYIRRTAMQDTVLGDAEITDGDKVVVSLTGANRDPKVFDRPHEFDITRSSKDAVAFGHGTHFCLGKHLAKLELKVVLEEMMKNVDHIEVTGPAERQPSTLINNIGSLPVKLVASR